jgi:hypothetical protein
VSEMEDVPITELPPRERSDAIPRGTMCAFCGARHAKVRSGCECYEDWALYCRPSRPGPGCPNGAPMCNRCARGGE